MPTPSVRKAVILQHLRCQGPATLYTSRVINPVIRFAEVMAKVPSSENVLIDGPAGTLEAMLELPAEADPLAIAVICHPHPSFGGTMLNKVVHTLARAFVSRGMASLRFNFRGVGKSEGEFDEAVGELDDALAAIDWLQARYPDLPLWLGGFSFGGAIAIRAALQVDTAGLVSVAPAVRRFAAEVTQAPDARWLMVQGDNDELVDIEETIEFFNAMDPGPELVVFEGGEHFFHGRLVELRATVEDFIGGD